MVGSVMFTHIPQWTERMYPGKTGRDHLGLGSVSSDQILPRLSPAINVLTTHPRYYSFYAFLLYEFWQRDLPRTQAAFKKFFRPREFIFSLGANLPAHAQTCREHGNMAKIVGAQTTRGLALEERGAYHTQVNYIKSSLGGYGLYYRTVMAELGIVYLAVPGGPLSWDVTTELGELIALAFQDAVSGTEYYQKYFDQNDIVIPRLVIEAYLERACLCQLQRDDAPDRELLRDLFLNGGDRELAESRRNTFRMFLDIAKQNPDVAFDQDSFRQVLCFGRASNSASYQPQADLVGTYKSWRLYQVREYYSLALSALWNSLCHWGWRNHGDIQPISVADFWEHLSTAIDIAALAEHLHVDALHLAATSAFFDLELWLCQLVGADPTGFDTACTLDAPIHEHRLYGIIESERHQPTSLTLTAAFLILAICYLRFGQPNCWEAPEWRFARMGTDGRLSLHEYIQDLRRKLRGGADSILEIAQWLFRDYVILQHQVVAARKLPDNTFRFRWEADRLRFYRLDNSVRFMDSRFEALSTMVDELGFCGNLTEIQHPLTLAGERLLAEGEI